MVHESFSSMLLPTPEISGINCVGIMWDPEECLAVCLVYYMPTTLSDNLLSLLEAVVGWALEFPWLLVLGDFRVHVNAPAYQMALGLGIFHGNARALPIYFRTNTSSRPHPGFNLQAGNRCRTGGQSFYANGMTMRP